MQQFHGDRQTGAFGGFCSVQFLTVKAQVIHRLVISSEGKLWLAFNYESDYYLEPQETYTYLSIFSTYGFMVTI